MRAMALATLAAGLMAGCGTTEAPSIGLYDRYEVHGVEEGDMLKLRAGPGTGFNAIAGLPNGTVVTVYACQQTGGTRWCEVSLDRASGLRGHVSWAYLRAI